MQYFERQPRSTWHNKVWHATRYYFTNTETTLTFHLRSPQALYGQLRKANIVPVLVKR